MGQRHPLSEEQVRGLRKNPHVRMVNANILSFTAEFKEFAYNERQKGVPMRDILANAGIDPDLMGARRIRNFSSAINTQGRRGVGFSDIVKKAPLPEEKKRAKTIEEKVSRLQHELGYVKQEVEYLKKVCFASKEVWSSNLKSQKKSDSN